AGRSDDIGPASDVYGLGATLYYLLTGRTPFDGGKLEPILRAVQTGEFPRPCQVNPSVHPALEAICLKAMSRQSGDRYPSPQDLADDIERWTADEPVSAWREPRLHRAQRWARRHRAAVIAAGAALLVALAAAVALAGLQSLAASRERSLTEK